MSLQDKEFKIIAGCLSDSAAHFDESDYNSIPFSEVLNSKILCEAVINKDILREPNEIGQAKWRTMRTNVERTSKQRLAVKATDKEGDASRNARFKFELIRYNFLLNQIDSRKS